MLYKPFKYCFVFVCQAGDLEIKSLLLAASLKCFLKGDFELVAAIPEPVDIWGSPSDNVLAALRSLGVRFCTINNPIGNDYPIGNKLACTSIHSDADYIIFLDSDMLCLQEFSASEYLSKHQFYAKPADLFTFGKAQHIWPHVYDCCETEFPTARVLSSVSAETMLPYFNAGFIVLLKKSSLASIWIECAQFIDRDQSIENKRPWLDQIALPVALAKSKLSWTCLDERFNFPLHLKPLQGFPKPFFCHYHSPEVIRREPFVNTLVQRFASDIPALTAHMNTLPAWKRLLQPHPIAEFKPPRRWFGRNSSLILPNILISGLPRSGTSYLCSLLHKIDNVVALNEPTEIFAALQGQSTAWGIATYHHDVRNRILDGFPIQNKLKNGQLVEDTSLHDKTSRYCPPVGRPDFLLCSKNTLAYLARIQQLRQAMPQSPIIICVRHPLDVIASWKGSFKHLDEARVQDFPVGGSNDKELTEHARTRLLEIKETSSPALKRALLWNHLAGLILANRQDIILIRYEDLVQRPREILQHILDQLPSGKNFRVPNNIVASSIRKKRHTLTNEDIKAANDICCQYAAELGYDCLQ